MSLNHIVQCISKPPSQRQDSEVSGLVEWFLKMCPLKIKPDVAKDILRNCEFRQCRRDDVIIRQGDLGDCFYICLSGKVSVYINTEAVPDDPEDEADVEAQEEKRPDGGATPPAAAAGASKAATTTTTSPAGKALGEKHELDRTKYGNFIVNFGAGKGFGELALINKDCVRNASIIADETTLLIVVNRALYNRSLKVVQEAEYRERISLVNSCGIFDNWASRYKKQAAMSLRKELYAFDAAIVRQGEPVNGLYFITSGQAKLVVNWLQHISQYPQLGWQEASSAADDVIAAKRGYGKIGAGGEAVAPDPRSQTAVPSPGRRQNPLLLRPHRPSRAVGLAESQGQSQRRTELSIVGPGEIIGDIEHGMDLATYAQSVVCTQPSEAFVLDAKNFDRLVLNKRNSARSLEVLAERARVKLTSRATRQLDWQVPLVRLLCRRVEAERLAREIRRIQPPARQPSELLEVRDSSVSHFIPSRGPLIDPYGPGTVFWRNRMQRELRNSQLTAAADKAKKLQQLQDEEQPSQEGQALESAEALQSLERRQATTVSQFRDAETSSEKLSSLEQRIEDWFGRLNGGGGVGDGDADGKKTAGSNKPVVALTRFRNEDDRKIYPGRRVCIRPRQSTARLCASLGNIETGNGPLGLGNPEDLPPGDQQVFITAQPEIRSRLSSASLDHIRSRPFPGTQSEVTAENSKGPHRQDKPAGQRQSHNQALTGGLLGAQGTAAPARAPAADSAPSGNAGTAAAGAGQLRSHHATQPVPAASSASTSTASSLSSASNLGAGLPPIDNAASRSSSLTPAERRQNTTLMLRDILNNQTLPDDVRATLLDLQRMSSVLPDLDSCPHHQTAGSRGPIAGGVKMGGSDGKVCYRCRRHHLAATLL